MARSRGSRACATRRETCLASCRTRARGGRGFTGWTDGLSIFQSMSDSVDTVAEGSPGLADALALGLRESEYELICELQGCAPNEVELAMYSLFVERALRVQARSQAAAGAPDGGPAVVLGAGRERGRGGVGDGWRARSRSSRTTIRAPSSRSRAPRPGWAASSATSSRWARARSRVLDSLRFGAPGTRGRAIC